MTDQLSATDWLDAGLKALAASGVAALKADPLAKALGVSRGSFYWHFRDVEAYHTAVLARWRDIATERIIANVEKHADAAEGVEYLLRGAFAARSISKSRYGAGPPTMPPRAKLCARSTSGACPISRRC